MISFNKIVKKLCKKGGNIIFLTDIFEIIDPELKNQHKTILNKTVYRLKSEGYIIALKNGVFIVPDNEDASLNPVDLIDKYYLKLIKKYITREVGSEYYISGSKSLEFHMKNYSLPEKIYITNRSTNKKIKIGNYEIIFKTISGRYQGKKCNLFSILHQYTKKIEIESIDVITANLELSLLEAAIIGESYNGVEVGLLVKAIRKYGKVLNTDTFYHIAQYKYIMAFNRLKEIAKPLDTELYQTLLDVIKKNGNLFIGEGSRAI